MFKQKPDRPYLKVCTECHGKGQLSYFNTNQEKTYGACKKCTRGDTPNGGLGVTLKCFCKDKSARYDFLRVPDLKFIKGLDPPLVEGLKAFQQECGSEFTALMLLCDCGAAYLATESGARRRIRGDSAHNKADKGAQKGMAAEIAARGIVRVLKPSPDAKGVVMK